MTVTAVPSFADLASQSGLAAPGAPTMNAPSGGALAGGAGGSGSAPPPPPAAASGYAPPANPQVTQAPPPTPGSPPTSRSTVEWYEQQGILTPGQFATDVQLMQYLASVAAQEPAPASQPATPRPAPAAHQQPSQPSQPSQALAGGELMAAANAMQTAGLLSVANGVWTAISPVAAQIAAAMNERQQRAQLVQAELADPTAFIQKHGAAAFQEALQPFQQQLQMLQQQNQMLMAQVQAAQPKPYDAFIQQNQSALYTVGADGKRNLLPAGHAYNNAWQAAVDQGITEPAVLHAISAAACSHLITPANAPPQTPQQPWINSVPKATDPSFSAPGTALANSGAPPALGLPTTNDGFPDFTQMARQLQNP